MTGMITAPGWDSGIGVAVIPGGVAGDHTVPGSLQASDDILSVHHCSPDLVTNTDVTAEYSVTGANLVNNTTTSSAGLFIVVVYLQSQT